MRQRSVNEKAVKKLIAYLSDLQKDLNSGIFVTGHVLQTKHGVSKSTYSVCKKLKIVTDDQKWNVSFAPDRLTAIKILEFLRQQSDKQTDKPISDMWCQEVSQIKLLLSEIRDRLSEKNNRSEGLKIAHNANQSKSDRIYIAGQIAVGAYSHDLAYIRNSGDAATFEQTNAFIIEATDNLLKQLNS